MEQKQAKNKQDSFAKRRKLFKNVWDAAHDLEGKKHKTKPKVIKTLRLSDMDDINIGKNKKQRIKYLRSVCTRLLDFCNRQDPDGMNELLTATCQESFDTNISSPISPSPKGKKRRVRRKKKVQQVYTYVTLPVAQSDKNKISLSLDAKVEGPITHRGTLPLRDLSAPRLKRSTLIKQYLDERHNLDNPPPLSVTPTISENKPAGDALRKVVKKKHRIIRPAIVPAYTTKVSNQKKKHSGTKKKMKKL